VQRPDAWNPPDAARHDTDSSRADDGGSRNKRSCRNC
jgi:hypothetical protein